MLPYWHVMPLRVLQAYYQLQHFVSWHRPWLFVVPSVSQQPVVLVAMMRSVVAADEMQR